MAQAAPPVVEIEFTTLPSGNPFVVGDPVKGRIGSATYTLAGSGWVDVTDTLVSVSVQRGKSTELDRYNAGTCTVVLDNFTALYDPTIEVATSQYPYAGQIIPGKNIRVRIGLEEQFHGVIRDWNFDYPLDALPTASALCSDRLQDLGQRDLNAQTFASGLSSAMITAVLNTTEVQFSSAERDIQTGSTTMQSVTLTEPTNALTFLQTVTQSEPGDLYASKEGLLAFRSNRYNPSLVGAVVIATDGSGITPSRIEVEYGYELLYNRANITRAGGVTQTADNYASQNEYGILSISLDGLYMSTDSFAQSMAQWYANAYSAPAFRPRRVEIEMASLTGEEQGIVSGLDLNDLVLIKLIPPGGQLIERFMTISAVGHNIVPGSHQLVLDLISANSQSMIWGDASEPASEQPLSLLDSNTWAF
jgi:hypothetical protein